MALIKCPECGKEISDKVKNCINCGFPIEEKKQLTCMLCGKRIKKGEEICEKCKIDYQIPNTFDKQEEDISFDGIYRISFLGKKQKVYCPRCGSQNCQYFQQQKIIPGKTKTKYTANLNPFKPFTLINKKEKVVREDKTITESKIMCNDCGNIFD